MHPSKIQRVFFNGTSTIRFLLMHQKIPIPHAQNTDIIYHWKCPAYNCTAVYIGKTSRSLKEWVSDYRNQTTSAMRNYHFSTKHPEAILKDFTITDRDSNILHYWAKEALHICIKDLSLNRNTDKVRIPSVFNKLLKPHTQVEQPHSSILPSKGHLLHLVFQHKRQLTLHTFLVSIHNRSVIPMFTPFKLQDNWIFRFPPSNSFHTSQSVIFSKKYLSFNFSSFLISLSWSVM